MRILNEHQFKSNNVTYLHCRYFTKRDYVRGILFKDILLGSRNLRSCNDHNKVAVCPFDK